MYYVMSTTLGSLSRSNALLAQHHLFITTSTTTSAPPSLPYHGPVRFLYPFRRFELGPSAFVSPVVSSTTPMRPAKPGQRRAFALWWSWEPHEGHGAYKTSACAAARGHLYVLPCISAPSSSAHLVCRARVSSSIASSAANCCCTHFFRVTIHCILSNICGSRARSAREVRVDPTPQPMQSAALSSCASSVLTHWRFMAVVITRGI